jgi:hypothetical protein
VPDKAKVSSPVSCEEGEAIQSLFRENFYSQKPITVTIASNKRHPPAPLADEKAGLCA